MIEIKYFTAAWCGPCRVLGPIMDQVEQDFQKEVSIEKIDVDTDRNKLNEYGVTSVPTLIFLKDGELIDRTVGVQSKSALDKKIRGIL
jgi:thioredoxin 1